MLCDKSNANRETIIKSWEDDKNPFRFESLQVDAAIKVSALETQLQEWTICDSYYHDNCGGNVVHAI